LVGGYPAVNGWVNLCRASGVWKISLPLKARLKVVP
jgi:hypothetical protein